ncbi:MAG: hypothetical protein KF830_14370 [Planctomycetes bacterium]|nr:hypothetical protein [Planctomycetota bacterium]
MGKFVRVAAGYNNTMVIRSDGRVFVQGDNYFGVCNVPQPPAGLQYVDIAINIIGVGLLSDGSVTVWGGAQAAPTTVPPLPPGVRYTQVACSGDHVLALRSDGSLVAWGRNLEGQCNVPPLPSWNAWAEISAGASYSLARLADGTVLAWGANTYGQTNVPALPPGMHYVSINTLRRHAVAVRSDGEVVAWGDNSEGQCNVPPLPAGTTYLLAAAGESHSQAVRSDGVIVPWGGQSLGQADVPTVPAGVQVVQIDCGLHHAAALLSTGEVLAWGYNNWQQAFLPTLPPSQRPIRYTGVSNHAYHVLALTSANTIQGWGSTLHSRSQVPAVLQSRKWVKTECGFVHNLALDDRGDLVGWGDNGLGQLNVPALPPGTTYTRVFAAAPSHSVAVRSDGVAVVFGTPVSNEGAIPPLPIGMRYTDVDVEEWRTVLLRSDGAVICLGDTANGQHLVVPLPPHIQYVDIATSRFCTAGIRSDGRIEAWGSVGPPTFTPLPALPFGVVYVELEGAYNFFAARRSDGRVVTCGHTPLHQSVVPALDPGTSYVEISAASEIVTGRVGPTCTYVSFAQGCAGSRPSTRLIPRDTPHLAKTLEVTLFDLPLDIAFLVFGWERLPNPVGLGSLGMPGCDLRVSLDAIVPLVGSNHQAKWFLPIPNDPIWVGTRFHNQALVPDPAAGNGLGAVVSDAAEAVIGHW